MSETVVEKVEPEKVIDVAVYRINSHAVFTTYTGTFCLPCKKIKPHLEDFLKKYSVIEYKKMPKSEYKKNVNDVVPFFVFTDKDLEYKIQTSDKDILRSFLVEHGIVNLLDVDTDF